MTEEHPPLPLSLNETPTSSAADFLPAKKTVRRGRSPKAKTQLATEQVVLSLATEDGPPAAKRPEAPASLSVSQETIIERRPKPRPKVVMAEAPPLEAPKGDIKPALREENSIFIPQEKAPEAAPQGQIEKPFDRPRHHPRDNSPHFKHQPSFHRHHKDQSKKHQHPQQYSQQQHPQNPHHKGQQQSQQQPRPPHRDFNKKNHFQSPRSEAQQPLHAKKSFKEPISPKGQDKNALRLGRLPFKDSLKSIESLDQFVKNAFNPDLEPLDFNTVYNYTLLQLIEELKARGLGSNHLASRKALLDTWLEDAFQQKRPIKVSGLLDIINSQGDGVLVYSKDNYHTQAFNTFIPQVFIKSLMLKKGQEIEVLAMAPSEDHSCLVALDILSVMGKDPAENLQRIPFTELVPYYPLERIFLETNNEERWDNLSMRTLDLLSPIGFGQRGLIVAPPRTGKTVLLQAMANAIAKNYPKAYLIILLVDERPEEVTDFKRHTSGEVVYSTFDADAQSHVHVAEMVIEKARSLVEVGQNVVILLDSITRLARAYNSLVPSTGKILSGGIESNALQGPKRLFGSARNIEDGGSLTIIGTALVETGSKMDEVIFEEFKGTGNMELHLDRGLSDKRIFPAISFERSGTRKEELLYHKDELTKVRILRRSMKGVPSNEAMEMFIQKVSKTPNNASFLMSLK